MAVHAILNCIYNNSDRFTHREQTEILNKVALHLIENKKETRKLLIEEARELQDSLKDLQLFMAG